MKSGVVNCDDSIDFIRCRTFQVMNKNSILLEKTRTTQQSVINRLETQIQSLETTVTALADFISDAVEHHRDLSVPGDVCRILRNLKLAEMRSAKQGAGDGPRRKPCKNGATLKKSLTSTGFAEEDSRREALQELNRRTSSLRGIPLKVIVDEDDEDRKRVNGTSSNLTSKITSGVHSLFNPSHGRTCHDAAKFGEIDGRTRRSFSGEIGALHLKESVINSHGRTKQFPLQISVNSESEANAPEVECPPAPFHPLNSCSDVAITYNGTTKLKSIKSGHKLNASNTTIPCE